MAEVTVTIYQGADGPDDGGDDDGDGNDHHDHDNADTPGDSECNTVEDADRNYASDHVDQDCKTRPPTFSTACVFVKSQSRTQ